MNVMAALVALVVFASSAGCLRQVDEPVERNSDGTPREQPPSPADLPGKALTLDYADFGPQAAAHALLGMDCWQWVDCCCGEPDDAYDIRVVVYRGVERAEITRRYPTVPGRSDFRLVSHRDALRYLDEQIEVLESEMDIPSLLAGLRATRARIIAALGR